MGQNQIRTIQDFSLVQIQVNSFATLLGAQYPGTGYALPASPVDGQIFILQPTNTWYQYQTGAWVVV